MKRIPELIRDNQVRSLQIAFISLAVLIIPAYIYARYKMTMIMGYLYVWESNITLNFILLLFLCGYFTDKYTKGMSKKKAWTIWIIQFILVIMFFRLIGGFKTILG